MNKQQKCINKFVLIQEALGNRWGIVGEALGRRSKQTVNNNMLIKQRNEVHAN